MMSHFLDAKEYLNLSLHYHFPAMCWKLVGIHFTQEECKTVELLKRKGRLILRKALNIIHPTILTVA